MTFFVQEMISNYLYRNDKDVYKLREYAKEFGVMEVVEKEILQHLQ